MASMDIAPSTVVVRGFCSKQKSHISPERDFMFPFPCLKYINAVMPTSETGSKVIKDFCEGIRESEAAQVPVSDRDE